MAFKEMRAIHGPREFAPLTACDPAESPPSMALCFPRPSMAGGAPAPSLRAPGPHSRPALRAGPPGGLWSNRQSGVVATLLPLIYGLGGHPWPPPPRPASAVGARVHWGKDEVFLPLFAASWCAASPSPVPAAIPGRFPAARAKRAAIAPRPPACLAARCAAALAQTARLRRANQPLNNIMLIKAV